MRHTPVFSNRMCALDCHKIRFPFDIRFHFNRVSSHVITVQLQEVRSLPRELVFFHIGDVMKHKHLHERRKRTIRWRKGVEILPLPRALAMSSVRCLCFRARVIKIHQTDKGVQILRISHYLWVL